MSLPKKEAIVEDLYKALGFGDLCKKESDSKNARKKLSAIVDVLLDVITKADIKGITTTVQVGTSAGTGTQSNVVHPK